jgi:hypothetical protein
LIFAFLFAVSAFAGCKENTPNSSTSEEAEATYEKSGYLLVDHGVSEYVVLLPKNPSENEYTAANELTYFLGEATQANIAIVNEGSYNVSEKSAVISIGDTAYADQRGVTTDGSLDTSGYIMKTIENQLFIRSDGNGMGCVYGVYDLLETSIGYRYYYTDEIYYQTKETVDLYKYDIVADPDFDFRAISTWNSFLEANEDYLRRTRTVTKDEGWAWGGEMHVQLRKGGHGVINKDLWYDAHKYGTVKEDGTPNHWFSESGVQLCWTAGEEMYKQAAEDIYQRIKTEPTKTYFGIGQADVTLFCNCSRCRQAKEEWALNDAGLDFFYLPNVVKELCESTDTDLLRRSIEFLVPSGDHSKLSNLHRLLSELNCSTFYKMISAHYKIYPNNVPFSSFLLVKVHEGYKLDDANVLRKSIDFLCIDVSCEIKRRVLQFVNLLERPVYQLSYEGYYRLLYDYLSSESKIMSSIVLNERYDFYLSDLNGQQIVFESSPQSRSFYLLLLFYGCTGISQSLFDEALLFLKSKECLRYVGEVNLDISALKLYLLRQNSAVSRLLYNLILIYENISSKSAVAPHFLKYIESILNHRSSLKNYINNGFAQVNGLANSDEYFVKFNKESRSYYLSISTSFFEVFEWDKDDVYPITDSNLWCNLR